MNILLHYVFVLLIPTVILLHLLFSPYTKVEESFNIQAIHDILVYGIPLKETSSRIENNFDHASFPGSVPRTFIGALATASAVWPLKELIPRGEALQIVVRGVIGLCNGGAILLYYSAVNQAFGKVAGYWYLVIQASQFHIMYYASRSLPNMFALPLTTLALRYVMLSKFGSRAKKASRASHALALLTFAGVVFRSEIAILVATVTASLHLVHKMPLRTVIIPTGVFAATVALLVTVAVDSFFWQQFPIWPEFVAFRFNTLEGKSAEWGTQPWHFYFTNSIPRLLLNPLLLLMGMPIAMAVKSTRSFSTDTLLPLLGYVAIYSILPHKEWRFIIYVIPGLNAVSAAGAAWLWTRKYKSTLYGMMCLAMVVSTIASAFASVLLLYISALNYPGAAALDMLHTLTGHLPSQSMKRVHLDNLSCQTGVTRFLEIYRPFSRSGLDWVYDKTENTTMLEDPEFWQHFDYAILEHPNLEERLGNHWQVINTVEAYAGVTLSGDGVDIGKHAKLPIFGRVIDWVKHHITRGKWPGIRMDTKLYILENTQQSASSNHGAS